MARPVPFAPAQRSRLKTCLSILALAAALAGPAAADGERVVSYRIVDARAIPDSLTGAPGDAAAGRVLYFDREQAGCSGCHGSPDGPGAERGAGAADAPGLKGLGARMNTGTLRLWLVAPEVLKPGTAMPGYYAVGQRSDPNDPRYGEPRLRAEEIENLIAYLAGLG